MKAYGASCPLCCGDIQTRRNGGPETVACSFCEVLLACQDIEVTPPEMYPVPIPFLAGDKTAPVSDPSGANQLSLFEASR